MKKILLVEDDPFISDIYGTSLKKAGYSFSVARDCDMAGKKIKENRPDLIILDIDFGPEKMNGWEFLELLRSEPQTKDLNVIILSNHNEDEHPEKIAQLKVKKFFLKVTTNVEEIVDYVKEELG